MSTIPAPNSDFCQNGNQPPITDLFCVDAGANGVYDNAGYRLQGHFPGQPIEGLTVTIEERGDHIAGYFNFVVQK